MPEAVRMSGISKSFAEVRALQEVDFAVRRGEIHALLGEDGAGKSTLLKILRGLEAPDSGTIEIDGERVRPNDPEAFRRAGVAMVFQETSLVPTLSAAQNIFLDREPRNWMGLIDDRRTLVEARALLDAFEVSVDPAAPASSLGAGQRQLTEIVKAVSQRSRVLILDEPASALSGAELERLFGMLRRLKGEGVAIVLVSQRMDDIVRVADRATVLRDGRRVITAPVSDLTLEMMVECIIGRPANGNPRERRESEQRFQQLAENIHEVFWITDPKARQVFYVSPAFEQVWGRSSESVYVSPGSFFDSVHDEDRPRVVAAFEDEIGQQVRRAQEYRIVRPDGSIRWIRDRSFPIRDDAGEAYRLVRISEDVSESKRVEGELQNSLVELRALAAHLQSVREEERTRVAREIHDELGQALTAIRIELSAWLRESAPAERASVAGPASILGLVDRTIQSVRRISTELRPGILDDLGLVAAVEWATEEFEARTRIKCRVDVPRRELHLDPERATAVFRILQETLTNVARHAEATRLDVRLAEEGDDLWLEVHDNGKGVNEAQLSSGSSLGILGMRERALLLGGEIVISGATGQGTNVRLRIPGCGRREGDER